MTLIESELASLDSSIYQRNRGQCASFGTLSSSSFVYVLTLFLSFYLPLSLFLFLYLYLPFSLSIYLIYLSKISQNKTLNVFYVASLKY